jgi:hypothetical protein
MEHVNTLCKQDAELLILMEMIHITQVLQSVKREYKFKAIPLQVWTRP